MGAGGIAAFDVVVSLVAPEEGVGEEVDDERGRWWIRSFPALPVGVC